MGYLATASFSSSSNKFVHWPVFQLGRPRTSYTPSQMGSVVTEGDLMRVLAAIVEEFTLGQLVDDEPEEDASNDALPHRRLHHVQRLVVDPVQLLQALQVVLPAWRVGDGPHAQVVHVAQLGPAVLEGDPAARLLILDILVLELDLGDIVGVFDGVAGFQEITLKEAQLAAHFVSS